MPIAAKPLASALPRVSANPGLGFSNCIGTTSPMASSTAMWLVDMRDVVTPLRFKSDQTRHARGRVFSQGGRDGG